jgi:hypothetical protein
MDKAVQTMELEVSEAIPKHYVSYFAKSFRGTKKEQEKELGKRELKK